MLQSQRLKRRPTTYWRHNAQSTSQVPCVHTPLHPDVYLFCTDHRLVLPSSRTSGLDDARMLLIAVNRLVSPGRYRFTPVLSVSTRVSSTYVETRLLRAALGEQVAAHLCALCSLTLICS